MSSAFSLEDGVTDLSKLSDAVWSVVKEADMVIEDTLPWPPVTPADAVAALVIGTPASTSAWVTTYVNVQVLEAFLAKEALEQVPDMRVPEPLKSPSLTEGEDSDIGDVFVIVYENVTVSPAFTPEDGDADDVNDKLGGTANVTGNNLGV